MEGKAYKILSEAEETIVNSLLNALVQANKTMPEHVNWQAVYA